MAKRHFHLSNTEIGAFQQREQQTRHTSELKRLQAVRLYGSGKPVPDILNISGCAESSLREWVRAYQREGLAGLRDHYERSALNASQLTPIQRSELRERLHQYRPDQVLAVSQFHSSGQFWTVVDLKNVIQHWYGVVYADVGSYRRLLHECGFSYQRAERIYKSRPGMQVVADFEAELEKK